LVEKLSSLVAFVAKPLCSVGARHDILSLPIGIRHAGRDDTIPSKNCSGPSDELLNDLQLASCEMKSRISADSLTRRNGPLPHATSGVVKCARCR
jgi:hypothetical protein